LIQEMNATITKMNQSFDQRNDHMEASVGVLKDTLSSYVSNLEGTLGDKLDRVIRHIADSVDQTNEGIKREFQELRRVTEDMQQTNAKYTQQILQELGREIQAMNRQMQAAQGQQPARLGSDMGMRQNEY